jgi:four helix bundle protein
MAHRGYRDLRVFQLSYQLAIEVFKATKGFPAEEKYSLTDQLRKSSRSVPANVAEAWKKRKYPKSFVNKLIDAFGEAGETEVWIDTSRDCGYLTREYHAYFAEKYDEVSRMLNGMITQPEKFCH